MMKREKIFGEGTMFCCFEEVVPRTSLHCNQAADNIVNAGVSHLLTRCDLGESMIKNFEFPCEYEGNLSPIKPLTTFIFQTK